MLTDWMCTEILLKHFWLSKIIVGRKTSYVEQLSDRQDLDWNMPITCIFIFEKKVSNGFQYIFYSMVNVTRQISWLLPLSSGTSSIEIELIARMVVGTDRASFSHNWLGLLLNGGKMWDDFYVSIFLKGKFHLLNAAYFIELLSVCLKWTYGFLSNSIRVAGRGCLQDWECCVQFVEDWLRTWMFLISGNSPLFTAQWPLLIFATLRLYYDSYISLAWFKFSTQLWRNGLVMNELGHAWRKQSIDGIELSFFLLHFF